MPVANVAFANSRASDHLADIELPPSQGSSLIATKPR